MGELFLPGDPPIALNLRRSARARRLTLRVSALDGRVTLTLPTHVSEREAMAFAREKERWLRGHLDRQCAAVPIEAGARVPIEGRLLEVCERPGRGVHREEGALALHLADGRGGPRLRAWLRQRARARLAEASDRYAAAIQRSYARIALRDTRSRWGSCSSRGTLSYSWRLIMAPPEVLDYVAAHEVSHLQEMHHGPAFWRLVEDIHGPYEAPRGWLREHGAGLHRYLFDPA